MRKPLEITVGPRPGVAFPDGAVMSVDIIDAQGKIKYTGPVVIRHE